MLSAAQIFEAIEPTDVHGYAASRLLAREQRNLSEASAAQLAFLEWRALSHTTRGADLVTHPGDGVEMITRARGPLTDNERYWLAGLPISEPFMVDTGAVRQVAGILAALVADPLATPADVEFVRAIWEPIDRYQRRLVHEAEVRHYSEPETVPGGTDRIPDALADALRSADPTLDPATAVREAKRQLADYLSTRSAERTANRERAQAQLDRLTPAGAR